jgi:hypothetical protein
MNKTFNGGNIFSKDSRSRERLNDVPGPGTYKLPVKFADVPSYLIPSKEESSKYV